MIRLENYEVVGWEHAIRGMRNPKNSWAKSDSIFCSQQDGCDSCIYHDDPECPGSLYDIDASPILGEIGPNDHKLMTTLAKGGPVHAKYRRMITVYVDITAPLYWWKEFDTYKVGTVANSCSTMHKIHDKEFTLDDFSCEHLSSNYSCDDSCIRMTNGDDSEGWDLYPENLLRLTIIMLNKNRKAFLETEDKKYWWQMIQLLPSSYNQKRTVMLNYEVLAGIYKWRKDHKLDEWREFCKWIESMPYSEIITGEVISNEGSI